MSELIPEKAYQLINDSAVVAVTELSLHERVSPYPCVATVSVGWECMRSDKLDRVSLGRTAEHGATRSNRLRHSAALTIQTTYRGHRTRVCMSASRMVVKWVRDRVNTRAGRGHLQTMRLVARRLQHAYRCTRARREACVRSQQRGRAYRCIQRAFRRRDVRAVKDAALCKLRACAEELTVLRNMLQQLEWAICPITYEPIRTPVWCQTDGRVYERVSIVTALRRTRLSPLTRAPTTEADLLEFCQPTRTPNWDRVREKKMVVKCQYCAHAFKVSNYASTETMCRAWCDHVRDCHEQ